MQSKSHLKWILIGAFLGYFIFHPLLMGIGHLMYGGNVSTGYSLFEIIKKSFSLQMSLWSFAITFACALMGFFYGKLRLMEGSLRTAKMELEKQVVEKTADLKRANQELEKEVMDRKLAQAEIQRNYDTESVTNAVLRLSLEIISLEEVLKRTLTLILSIPWLAFESRGCIFLVEDDSDTLVMKAESGLNEILKKECARVPFGKCICGKAALKTKIEFTDCIDDRHDISYENMVPHGHYCVPILYGGKTLGVINLYIKEGQKRNEKKEGFLNAIADTLAGIIKRNEYEQALQDTLMKLRKAMGGAIELLANVVEVRDPYTAGHQKRVADLARSIATEMGVSQEKIEGIRMAGRVHDIGKISIPAEFLSKPTRLSELEFNLIKTHATVGYEILKDIEFGWPVAEIAYQHHEKLDGSGYPQGLSGNDILLEARILAVADVVEAMSSHRPYRPALGIDKALDEISKNKGTLYDAEVVDACLKLFQEKEYQLK